MEFFVPIIFLAILIYIIWYLERSKSSATTSSINLPSSSSSSHTPPKKITKFKIRVRKSKVKISETGAMEPAILVEGKGLLPVVAETHIGSIVKVFDNTDDNCLPILSSLSNFREKESNFFQDETDLGFVESGDAYSDWHPLGVIPTNYIQAPKSGLRKLKIVAQILDSDRQSNNVIWDNYRMFPYEFYSKGYDEVPQDLYPAKELSLMICVAVAMADGSLHKNEGKLLNKWIRTNIAHLKEPEKTEHKDKYNDTLRNSFEQAKNGDLIVDDLLKKLCQLKRSDCEYDTLELAYKIMVSDGIIHPGETAIINLLVDMFSLDSEEVDTIKNNNIIEIIKPDLKDIDLLKSLGISPELDPVLIRDELAIEFQKWNNRFNIVPLEQRNEIQEKIDKIAQVRNAFN